MIRLTLLVAAVFLCAPAAMAKKDLACLPSNIKGSDVVTSVETYSKGKREVRKTTVEQTLKTLSAKCRKNTLVDSTGKEIRFHKLVGCWGHPPSPEDQAILDRQKRELADLRKRYHVIEMTCNPSGWKIPQSRPEPQPPGPQS